MKAAEAIHKDSEPPTSTEKPKNSTAKKEKVKEVAADKAVPSKLTVEEFRLPESKFSKEYLEKIDGACEYFYQLEKENEEKQQEYLNSKMEKSNGKEHAESSSGQSRDLHELPKGYPQKYMFKPPKVNPVKYQIEVDKNLYRGDPKHYELTHDDSHLVVYANQHTAMPKARAKKRIKRSHSEEFETFKFVDNLENPTGSRKL